MKQKNAKKFLVLKIIAFESGTRNSHNPERDTCHWESMCYETSLRFNMSLRKVFFKSGFLRVMKKYEERALLKTLQDFGTLEGSSETVFFREWCNQVFHSQ